MLTLRYLTITFAQSRVKYNGTEHPIKAIRTLVLKRSNPATHNKAQSFPNSTQIRNTPNPKNSPNNKIHKNFNPTLNPTPRHSVISSNDHPIVSAIRNL